MTGKEALEEIKDYTLVTYDDEGNEEDCWKFGELEPNLIEAVEEDLEDLEESCKKAQAFDIIKKYLFTKQNNGTVSIWKRDSLYELQVLIDNKVQLHSINEEEFEIIKEVLNE